ncbi:MAG TPA: FixH family protein [Steroidobacteraceae bacterium]|nr:FixH family protein [Steroidobacteraceae bacterium]HQR48043.1 FixH family protein [Steroidobacteraceae bacterium]
MNPNAPRPWYRQLWPWLLMLPPAGAVVGGALTYYLAVTRPDTLVRQDCVQDGVTMKCGETDEHRAP